MTVFIRGKDAFSFAFAQYMNTVYRVAVHNTRCKSDAEDVTQEVFAKLIESSKSFKDSEHLKAWLIRVTINQCRSLARKYLREAEQSTEPTDCAVYDGNSVLEAVKALPENYRNAIYLHYYEGYTAKEIGRLLDAKENTVLSWLSRGRAALRKDMIGGFEDE